MPILMLIEILAVRVDALGSKLHPVHSSFLTRATEPPVGTTCLAVTSSSRALVHPHSRMHHFSDAFPKVHTTLSLHRISLKHAELPRGHGRKKGMSVLSSKVWTTNQKNRRTTHLQLMHAFPSLRGVRPRPVN